MSASSCPGCGRVLPVGRAKCMYCGARVATGASAPVAAVDPVAGVAAVEAQQDSGPRICPGCQRPAKGRVVRCFYCGADLPPIRSTPKRDCPRCQVALKAVTATWVGVDVCPTCAGVFYDGGELEREQRVGAQSFAWLKEQLRPCPPESGQALCCPGCGKQMRALSTSGETALVIDNCPACTGWWLDAGELEHLRQMARQRSVDAPVHAVDPATVKLDPKISAMLARQAEERIFEKRRRKGIYDEAIFGFGGHHHGTTSLVDMIDLAADVVGWLSD